MQSYIEQLRLNDLDLSTIEITPAPKRPWWGILRLLLGSFAIFLLIWVPQTQFFSETADSPLILALLLGLVAVFFSDVLVFGVRAFQDSLPQWHWQPRRYASPQWATLNWNKTTQRWIFFSTALILASLLIGVMPQGAEWHGQGYSGMWFMAVIMAIATGIAVGRWLMAQEPPAEPISNTVDNADQPAQPAPWWQKWVSLGVVVLMALGALFWGDSQNSDQTFGRSAMGFIAGVLGAMWLVQRFEAMETQLRRRHQLKTILQELDKTSFD